VTSYVRLTGTGQLIELRRRLRRAGGPRLQQNFARRLRRAAEPMRADLQSTMRSLRVAGSGGGNPSPTTRPLRATIAAAIRLSVRYGSSPGARVWIDRSALPADLRNMPNRLNDGFWRHPVFGNRHAWVRQTARPYGWWDKTIDQHKPRMAAEVERVLNDVRRSLD
jgi:hypothetical protein